MSDDPKPVEDQPKAPTLEEWEKAQKAIASRDEANARLAKKLADMEAKEKAAIEEQAKKNGEFENLYKSAASEKEALAARVASYEAERQAELDALMADLDDASKEIVQNIIPEKQLVMARKLAGRKPATVAGGAPVGERGQSTKSGGYKDDIEWAKKDYAGYKKWRDSQRS